MADKHEDDRRETEKEFEQAVNMTPSALREWLDKPESRDVGMTHDGEKAEKDEGPESVGHEMGRRILALLDKKRADWNGDDHKAARKVIGYVHRHLAQRPDGDVKDSRWRKSLMNWGHDPLK